MSDKDNLVKLRKDLPGIPEELLRAQSEHKVIFLCGAGISIPSGVPDFCNLVKQVYQQLDPVVHKHIKDDCILPDKKELPELLSSEELEPDQCAEIKRFIEKDYSTVFDFLENRYGVSLVRKTVQKKIIGSNRKSNELHKCLLRLASQKTSRPILTTNYDLLLEDANKEVNPQLPEEKRKTHNIKNIPRPSTNPSFSGVFHLHGAFPEKEDDDIDIILTQKDFGEYYLNHPLIPYFMQRVCRLFHLVLVGYRADDLFMRNLISSISEEKFYEENIKKIYVFHGVGKNQNQSTIEMVDWRLRKFTPIEYSLENDHRELEELFREWADISAPMNADPASISKEKIKEIVGSKELSKEKSDLFDYLYHRSVYYEQHTEVVKELKQMNAEPFWLDRIIEFHSAQQPTTTDHKNKLLPSNGELNYQIRNFWETRIEEPQALIWAMEAITKLEYRFFIEEAISELLDIFLEKISPEWLKVWRLLLEGPWMHNSTSFHFDRSDYDIRRQLYSKDYSCKTILLIVDFVRPFFYLRTSQKNDLSNDRFSPYEFFKSHIQVHGGYPNEDKYILEIYKIKDSFFLDQLALLLQKSIDQYLRMLSQNEEYNDGDFCKQYVRLVYDPRIYPENKHIRQNPNRFNTGLSAAINVLHCSVAKLCEIDKESAMTYLCRWRNKSSPIYLRLWAAIATYHDLIDKQEIFSFLMDLDHQFEDTYNYPEISELRAKRFSILEKEMQEKIIGRMLKVLDQ